MLKHILKVISWGDLSGTIGSRGEKNHKSMMIKNVTSWTHLQYHKYINYVDQSLSFLKAFISHSF